MKSAFLSFAVLTSSAIAIPANADEPFQFLKITCAKELHYFGVQRILVYNPPANGPYRDRVWRVSPRSSARLAKLYGIFDIGALAAQAYACAIPRLRPVEGWEPEGRPAISMVVRSVKIPKASRRGTTSIGQPHEFEVLANGKILGTIDIGFGRPGSDVTGIEVKADGVGIDVRICRAKDFYGESAITPDENICTHANLSNVR